MSLRSPAGATFPGTNGKIAFAARSGDGTTDIYSIDPDGSTLRQLTDEPGFDSSPAWSPDGNRIAFGRQEGLYVMNADGSGKTQLTNTPDGQPAWSPDGEKIAFVSDRDGNPEIYSMNADGSGHTRLTDDPTDDVTPSWSPDGQRIAFSKSPRFATRYDIYVMNTDGSGLTQITTDGAPNGFPDWSPDGRRFVFSKGFIQSSEIYVMNVDGSDQTRLTANNVIDQMARWSPDGQRIVFQRVQGSPTIYVMNPDGTAVSSLGVGGFNPNWGTHPAEPDCSDGLDNDGDGNIDFPADPGCRSLQGNDERDRKGAFSCRASAVRVGSDEPVVANPGDTPCVDDDATLASASARSGPTSLTAKTLTAATDMRPDQPAVTLPAAGDHATGDATVEEVIIRSGDITIAADVVTSHAEVTCRGTPLTPRLSGSSSVARLKISGMPIAVGDAHLDVPLGSATLHVNHTVAGAGIVVQRALWLESADSTQDVVVAETRADFTEDPCA